MNKIFFLKGFLAAILSITIAAIFGGSLTFAEAVTTRGLFTDSNDVRWEYERVVNSVYTTEPETVSIMFYDKPAATTTIIVPSLDDVLAAIPDATQTLNTYYIKNADIDYQAANYTATDQVKRVSSANVTVLDMTNTSKIQVKGVAPIIDPNTEVELIFGENMVIGDGIEVTKSLSAYGCVGTYTYFTYSYNTGWHCDQTGTKTIENIQENIVGWDELNIYEKKQLNVGIDDIVGLSDSIGYMNSSSMIEGEFDETKPYFFHYDFTMSTEVTGQGAFEGYHLKLTNLDNVKYFGWYAFKNAIFDDESRSITIRANQTAGEGVFEGSNVSSVILEGSEVFPAMFRDCVDLSIDSIDFGNATMISYNAFEGAGLNGSIDFGDTTIKTIKANAFEGAGITGVDLDGVEVIEFEAFKSNDLKEIFLPKTINELGAAVFAYNSNLKKATVAYDTLTSGTMIQFATVLDGRPHAWGSASDNNGSSVLQHTLEELVVLAPYSDGEELKSTHLNYFEYRDHPNAPYYSTTIYTPYYGRSGSNDDIAIKGMENQYAYAINGYRNIIAPLYFAFLNGLKKITIGDGFEYIGNAALLGSYSNGTCTLGRNCNSNTNPLEVVVLPESLKGVGALVLQDIYNENFDMNLPNGLEYIGIAAFSELYFLKTDLDLPNLRFLGDYAFYGTQIHDVYLHDKIEYMGVGVFNDCIALHDITFDYDVFNPEKHKWWMYGSSGTRNYQLLFGSNIAYSKAAVERYGYEKAEKGGDIKYGTIKFTEKSIHPIPALCGEGYSCNESSIAFFDWIQVEKFDLGEAKWEYIPEYAFQLINAKEVVLPSGLKTIRSMAFLDSAIEEELILPDTLEVIEDVAFSQHSTWYYFKKETIKISKLPDSLKRIGAGAFYGDARLNIDEFNLPNLEVIGNDPFVGATIKKITLHDTIKAIGVGAFWHVFGIEDIIIDFDMFNLDNLSVGRISVETNHPWHASSSYLFDFDDSLNPYYFGSYFTYYETYAVPSDYYGVSDYGNPNFYDQEETLHQFNSIVFTEKVSFTPYEVTINSLYKCGSYYCSRQANVGQFIKIKANLIDLSRTGWEKLPRNTFMWADVGTILLPEELETIGRYAFLAAKVESELDLPDSIKLIEAEAFANADYVNYLHGSSSVPEEKQTRGIKITKLPESLEEVRMGAFYGDANLDVDIDLPNLRYVGKSAFMNTSIKNITLHDSINSPIMWGAFSNIPTLENIVIDYDFYGFNNNDVDINYYSNLEQTWVGNYFDFFSVFNTTPFEYYAGQGIFNGRDEIEVIPYNVTFTEKATTEPLRVSGYYTNAYIKFNKLDLSRTSWKTFDDSYFFMKTEINELLLPDGLEVIKKGAFYGAEIEEPLIIPSSVKVIEDNAFELAKVQFTDSFSEGLEAIGASAFYGAQVFGDITIPSTVTSIGWSAFNAGDTDVNYGTVTIKPALNYDSTDSQAIFQLFWNAKMDKLIVESPTLPVLSTTGDNPILPHEIQYQTMTNEGPETVTIVPTLREDGEPEFHGMTMQEVEIKNLPVITANAFEECGNLEKVSFVDSLESIERFAFNNDTKLKTFIFGNGLEGKDVALHEYAFNNTAVENMVTTSDSDFNLAAANFHTVDEHVFSNMPNLTKVSIPNNFNIDENLANNEKNTNGSHITSFTFADDPELSEVTIGYQVSEIRDGAFLNDEKLAKLFVWGNTEIQESDDLIQDFNNTTIPKGTTIFAYSDAPAEDYANNESRDEYDGAFYALDEVLAITAKPNTVILNEDKTDFDKTGLKLYAQRRDGVILEADWKEYNTAFKRTETPEGLNISFEEGRGRVGGDEADIAAIIYDAPKPFDTISLVNKNFENVSYEFLTMPSIDSTTDANPLVLVHYPDGYTNNIRNTTLVTKTVAEIIEEIITPDPEPEQKPEPKPEVKPETKPEQKPTEEPEEELTVPDTGAFGAIAGAAASSISIATIVVLGGIYLANRRRR